jgi:hypothetical protein
VQRALDATETTEPVEFSENIVGSGAVNSLRIYASANGFARNNTFGGVNGGHIIMQTGSSGWEISDNNFASWTNAIDTSGGGTGTKILRNTGFAPMLIIRANCVIENNEIGNFTLQSQATGGVFANNNISGTISHSTVNYGSNTWRDNRGAGTNGVFSGTATLVNGTATVTTAAAYSGKRIRLYRQSSGASSAIGALAVGTIDPGVSFVINALANDAGPPAAVITETGDLSVILWEIEG